MTNNYSNLTFLAYLFKGLAWLNVVAGIIIFTFGLFSDLFDKLFYKSEIIIAGFVYFLLVATITAISFIICFSISEMIHLFIKIEANTNELNDIKSLISSLFPKEENNNQKDIRDMNKSNQDSFISPTKTINDLYK